MPTEDGYPTKEELLRILQFEGSPTEFVEYINSIWWHDGFTVKDGRDTLFKKAVKRCYLSTWGWSGNEEIMEYIDRTWFRMLYWRSTRRGGHFEYEVPKDRWNSKELQMGAILDRDRNGIEPEFSREWILKTIEESREKSLPLAYIEKKVTDVDS